MRYTYDEQNRLINVNDSKQDVFDEIFAYDAQGRIVAQRRDTSIAKNIGGEYAYYANTNRLKSVADGMGGTADERNMSDTANFVYDSVGNLTYDKYLQGEGSKNALVHFYCRTVVYCALRNSKGMEILYDWRGMPIEFIQTQQPTGSSSDTLFRLLMKYDGTGRRISKTVMHKVAGAADWDTAQVTHYTGIGTEVRENYAGPAKQTKVVVNMPQSLGRYGIEDAENPDMGSGVGYIPNTKFEWYLKNHLGSTMLVYGTQADANPAHSDIGTTLAAYDYRAFGEMIELTPPPTGKVTENFTGKERDDEIALDYFGARYLDPMLGMWISVDPARQFASPYLYVGNGVNPTNVIDPDGEATYQIAVFLTNGELLKAKPTPKTPDKSEALISYHDFLAVQRWGREEFGDDFDMKIIRNLDEMIEFIKAGKYTAIVGHSFGDEGILVNSLNESAKFFSELSLLELNKNLIGTDSYAKAFACFTGEWPDKYSNIDLGKNRDLLPIGVAYENAGKYLVEQYNSTLSEKK